MLTYAETHCLDCDRPNADCACGFGRIGRTYPSGSVFCDLAESGHPPAAKKSSRWPDWLAKLFAALLLIYITYLACKAI